jgi:carbon-monoxide dehydrogenase medium subunit
MVDLLDSLECSTSAPLPEVAMFPARFEYSAPSSIDGVLDTLAEHGDEAKVLAGGQSLIPLLKLRFAAPALLVDLRHLDGLVGIEESDGWLRIGARTTHNQLAASDLVGQRHHLVAAAAQLIADPLVRNVGTIGGSLVHADPQADWASVLLALDGEVVVRSRDGERVVPATGLLAGPFETTLEPTELLVQVRVPVPSGPSGGAYLKLERKVGDFATVATGVHLELSNGTIAKAGIGLTAVGPSNLKAVEAERSLAGAEPTPEAFATAADLAAEAADPSDDVRGSADYKRAVVRAYVRRGLERALELARAA